MVRIKLYRLIILLLFISFISSCSKSLDVPIPRNRNTVEKSYTDKNSIDKLLLGVYGQYGGIYFAATAGGARMFGLLGDEAELANSTGDNADWQRGYINPLSGAFNQQWSTPYSGIYRANSMLENLPSVSVSVLKDVERKQYIATAKFFRAAFYFRLTQVFGDVPLILSTNLVDNISAPRTAVTTVLNQSITDIKDAIPDLPTTTDASRMIINKYIAEVLLAKIYAITGNWTEVETATSDIINNSQYQLVTPLTQVFWANSKETIWALGETNGTTVFGNFGMGEAFLAAAPPSQSTSTVSTTPQLSTSLKNSFEPGDQRYVEGKWIITRAGNIYSYKYLYTTYDLTRPILQHFVRFRFADIVLLRAEARAQLNKITGASGAEADINLIRTRAGLGATSASDKATMLLAVENERRHELFCENIRWFDLNRTGRTNVLMSAIPQKNAWTSTNILMPIPQYELLNNTNLTQNPGY